LGHVLGLGGFLGFEESITISRFLSGFNLDIRDRVEFLAYQDLNDLVQICIKVEQQNLRKSFSK